jgi:hypothetical protein
MGLLYLFNTGVHKSLRQVSMATKFYRAATNIFGLTVCNMFHVTILESKNFEKAPRLLEILCTPASRSVKLLSFHVCLVILVTLLK